MATFAAAHAKLCRLRRDIARIEGRLADDDRLAETAFVGSVLGDVAAEERMRRKSGRRLALGIAYRCRPRGRAASGGVDRDLRCAEPRRRSRERLFAGSPCAAHREEGGSSSIVWIGEADLGARQARSMRQVLLRSASILPGSSRSQFARRWRRSWAFEAALSCRGVGAAVCELRNASSISLPHAAVRFAPGEVGSPVCCFASETNGRSQARRNPLPRRPGAGRRRSAVSPKASAVWPGA